MPLNFTGETVKTLTGLSIRAKDSKGEPVTVKASSEALQDYGLERVREVASKKYDAGQTEIDGSIVIVVVHTGDCA
jgi:hypothetical protein